MPLISCLMVTRPNSDRLAWIERSVASFLGQSYADRELIVLSDGSLSGAEPLAAYLSALGNDRVRWAHLDGTHTLGALRNHSLQLARGEYLCQWDDDDLSHPMRLDIQSLPLRKGDADAAYLEDCFHWFGDRHELYWISFRGGPLGAHPGTVMVRRDFVAMQGLGYPETGPDASRGEDSHFLLQLRAAARVRTVSEMPELFVYCFHGQNTWQRAHHEKLVRKFGVDAARLRDALPRLGPMLDALPLERPYVLRAKEETIRKVGPGTDEGAAEMEVRLDGLRVLMVHPAEAAWLQRRAALLREGLARFGATDLRMLGVASDEDAAQAVVRAARDFRPSLIVDLGVRDVTACAAYTEAPILLLRSAWDRLPLPSVAAPPGTVTAVLWLDRPELTPMLPELPVAADLLGPLVGSARTSHATVSRPSLAVCGIDNALGRELAQIGELVALEPDEPPPAGVLAAIIGPGVSPYAASAMGVPVLGLHDDGVAARLWKVWEEQGWGKGFAEDGYTALCAHARAIVTAPRPGRRALNSRAAGEAAATCRQLAWLLIQLRAMKQSAARQGPPPIAALSASLDQAVEELTAETPLHAMSREAVQRAIEQGEWLGLPVWETGSGKVYSIQQAWNWMSYHVDPFFEAGWRGHLAICERAGLRPEQLSARAACCGGNGGALEQVRVRPQRYALTLEWNLDLSGLHTDRVRLFLRFPLAGHGSHGDISLARTWPSDFSDRLMTDCGYFYGVDLDAVPNLHVGYQAEITTFEVHTHGLNRPDPSPWRGRPLGDLLDDLANAAMPDQDKAWLLYEHMVRESRYEHRVSGCLCARCASQSFGKEHAGSCSLFASAYLGYCQRLGIPGRLVRGALLGYPEPDDGDRFVDTRFRDSPGHSWTEIQIDGVGWMPVELQHCSTNPKGLFDRRTTDPGLRREVARQFEALVPFYFGSLDNQRVVWSQSTLRMPTACYFDASRPLGQRWVVLDGWRMKSRLEFRYL